MARRRGRAENRVNRQTKEAAFRKLIQLGADEETLRFFLTVAQGADAQRDLLGSLYRDSEKDVLALSVRLEKDGQSVRRLWKSPTGTALLDLSSKIGLNEIDVRSWPETLALMSRFFRVARTKLLPLFKVSARGIPGLFERVLLAYVQKCTGKLRFDEIASLLECDPDALKQRYYAFGETKAGKRYVRLADAIASDGKDFVQK